jgi:predicted O-linked N-acetylglucosamine transferase (SPINDLY family)
VTAAGLPELIAPTLEEYVELAAALGRDRNRLGELKARLAAQAPKSPLFDSSRYVHHLEWAFESIYQRMVSGLPPDHINVPALN